MCLDLFWLPFTQRLYGYFLKALRTYGFGGAVAGVTRVCVLITHTTKQVQ